MHLKGVTTSMIGRAMPHHFCMPASCNLVHPMDKTSSIEEQAYCHQKPSGLSSQLLKLEPQWLLDVDLCNTQYLGLLSLHSTATNVDSMQVAHKWEQLMLTRGKRLWQLRQNSLAWKLRDHRREKHITRCICELIFTHSYSRLARRSATPIRTVICFEPSAASVAICRLSSLGELFARLRPHPVCCECPCGAAKSSKVKHNVKMVCRCQSIELQNMHRC